MANVHGLNVNENTVCYSVRFHQQWQLKLSSLHATSQVNPESNTITIAIAIAIVLLICFNSD